MIKTILITGIGVFVGYQLGAFVAKRRLPSPTEEEEGVPVARMARDFRRLSRDLDPLLAEIESRYADAHLSVRDIYAIATEAEKLL